MVIRSIEVERCDICGEEFDKLRMHEIFTGRKKYICMKCMNAGRRQIEERQSEWRKSGKAKQIIEQCEKNK